MSYPTSDLTGKIIGKLEVLRKVPNYEGKDGHVCSRWWWCRCACGVEKAFMDNALRTSRVKSCGAEKCYRVGHTFIDLTDKVFGRWTVIRRIPHEGEARWWCRCECGTEKMLRSSDIRKCNTTSCGCRRLPFLSLYHHLVRANLSRHNHPDMEISFEQFLTFTTETKCFYCWAPIYWAAYTYARSRALHAKRSDRPQSWGYNLDRIDNDKGYSMDNVVVSCGRCNFGRANRYSFEEWFMMTECFRIERGQQVYMPSSIEISDIHRLSAKESDFFRG